MGHLYHGKLLVITKWYHRSSWSISGAGCLIISGFPARWFVRLDLDPEVYELSQL